MAASKPLRAHLVLGLGAALSGLLGMAAAQAQPADQRTLTLYVGSPPGSSYDLYARLFARHFGRHLPDNPNVIVSNMPGAGSITCANYLYSKAAGDEFAIGLVAQTIAEEQAVGTGSVRFDARQFGWVGRISSNVEITYVWHTVPIKSIEDLKKRETVFAATGPSSVTYPQLLNSMAGTRFKLVRGYTGTPQAHLALERGEVEGVTSSVNTIRTSARDWMRDGKLTILVQYASQRHPELKSVPAVVEFGTTPGDRAILEFFANSPTIGRSIIAPPGLSAARLKAMRSAFQATMTDPQFVADIEKSGAEFAPLPGEDIESIVGRTLGIAPDLLERARTFRAK